MEYLKYSFFIHIEILVYQKIPHSRNIPPGNLWVRRLELIGQHSCSLTNYLDVLHYAIIAHHVFTQFIFCEVAGVHL